MKGWRAGVPLVLFASCAGSPSLPDLPATHPAHPHAVEAPVPPPSATLALPVPNEKR